MSQLKIDDSYIIPAGGYTRCGVKGFIKFSVNIFSSKPYLTKLNQFSLIRLFLKELKANRMYYDKNKNSFFIVANIYDLKWTKKTLTF